MNNSLETTIPNPVPRSSRLRRRWLLGCGLPCLLLVTLLLVFVIPRTIDEPPFHAPDLEVELSEIPNGENAAIGYAAIIEEADTLFEETEDLQHLWEEAPAAGGLLAMIQREPRLRDEYWEPLLGLLARVDAISNLASYRPPIAETSFRPRARTELDRVSTWMRRRAQIQREGAERRELLASLESWGLFARRCSDGTLDFLGLLESVRAAEDFADGLEAFLAETEGDLDDLLRLLGKFGLNRPQVSTALRLEFLQSRAALLHPQLTQDSEFDIFDRLSYRPNASVRILGEFVRAQIATGEATGRGAPPLEIPDLSSSRKVLLEGNRPGWLLLGLLAPQLEGAFQKSSRAITRVRAAQLMVALVMFEEAWGALPEELEELVPDLLLAIPLDPFDDQPLRYDRERRLVWGIDTDLVDDGGPPGTEEEESPDVVFSIPKRGS